MRRKSAADDVLLKLLDRYAPLWLAGLLGAGIMAAVMASRVYANRSEVSYNRSVRKAIIARVKAQYTNGR